MLAEIRAKGQEGIARRMFNAAGETDDQLRALGTRIAQATGAKAVFGPLKGRERAGQKVQDDYGGDWLELKDVARMTIVASSPQQLDLVRSTVVSTCIPSNGLGLIKNAETRPEDDPCGYSGMNFVVVLSNRRTGEIQANVAEVIYGKSSEQKFISGVGVAKYAEIKNRYKIRGGLGHTLYEIYRVAPQTTKAQQAASLSRSYYAYLRGRFPTPEGYFALQGAIEAFERQYPGALRH
jgi:hypothetical protein